MSPPASAATTSTPSSTPSPSSAYVSAKQLWQLVTEQSLVASDDVIEKELRRGQDRMGQGLAWFGRRKVVGSTTTTSQGKLARFISRLADLLQVDEDAKAKGVLQAYLASDFRGTKESLKILAGDDRLRGPLMQDVWHFYRAERLYVLQVRSKKVEQ